ncbi:hypothetical protein ACOME3_005010 [Neoechinorhynchus agilis]
MVLPILDCVKNHQTCARFLSDMSSDPSPTLKAAIRSLPTAKEDLENIKPKEASVTMLGVLVELFKFIPQCDFETLSQLFRSRLERFICRNQDVQSLPIDPLPNDQINQYPTFRKSKGGLSFTCWRSMSDDRARLFDYKGAKENEMDSLDEDLASPSGELDNQRNSLPIVRSKTMNLDDRRIRTRNQRQRLTPSLFTPLKTHDNYKAISIALSMSVLAGLVNKRLLTEVLQKLDGHHKKALESSECSHYVLLLKDHRLQYRALYYFKTNKRSNFRTASKMIGTGPSEIDESIVIKYLKYHLGTKQFVPMQSKGFSLQCDAVCIDDDSVVWTNRRQ